ncbi:hypothetical protein [Blastococcus sp. SYSU D00813]
MPWWAWLVGWVLLSTLAALWLGAAASIARRREQARREVDDALEDVRPARWWTAAG